MTGAQIFNNSCVWYSHNILPIIKMSNRNMTHLGTQITGLGIMIGRCYADSQHEGSNCHSVIVDCSFFEYTNVVLSNHTSQRRRHKTWTRRDNQRELHCYFRCYSTQRRYKKRMIEIWGKCTRFQTTAQSLADQVRTIIKNSWFSDIEIQVIRQKTKRVPKQ